MNCAQYSLLVRKHHSTHIKHVNDNRRCYWKTEELINSTAHDTERMEYDTAITVISNFVDNMLSLVAQFQIRQTAMLQKTSIYSYYPIENITRLKILN